MAITIDEFVNPKSMITPGAAAGLVAAIAGACFSVLGIVLPWLLVLLSFFVGCVVFFSKEFSDPAMTKGAKCFFYTLNSLIIFAMVTGTHSVLDRTDTSTAASVSFNHSAYAQGAKQKIHSLDQKRPFFFDWTKENSLPMATDSEDNGIVITTDEDLGRLTELFVDLGLIMPKYSIQIEIERSKFSEEVKSVTWDLPKAYFAQDKLVTTDKSENFAMNIQAWKPFEIGAEIELESGRKLRRKKVITFNAME